MSSSSELLSVGEQAAKLFEAYDVVVHEDLNVHRMAKGHLAKPIYDASWAQFIEALTCKAESAGKSGLR